MLKRLGRVVWWLGSLGFLVAVFSGLNAARLEYRASMAPSLNSELGRIQAQESALVSHYVTPANKLPKGSMVTVANMDAEFGTCDAALKDVHAAAAAQQDCAALKAQAKAVSKRLNGLQEATGRPESFALAALIAGVAGLFAWALAYVLGGAFWRPPSAG